MGLDAPWHWVILAIIVIALFGYKKLPDAARSLGRSLRIFKTEIKGMSEDDATRDAVKDKPTPAIAPAPPPPPAVTENSSAPAATTQADKPANSAQ